MVVHGQGISSRTNDGTYRAHKSPTVYVLGLNVSLHMVALSGAEVTLMAEPQPHVIFSHVLCYEVVKSCRKRILKFKVYLTEGFKQLYASSVYAWIKLSSLDRLYHRCDRQSLHCLRAWPLHALSPNLYGER